MAGIRRISHLFGSIPFGDALALIRAVFRKYQRDRANLIVSAISFYVLLTFIPGILLCLSSAGYLAGHTDFDEQLLAYLTTVVPDPFNSAILESFTRYFRMMELSRNLSGPVGLFFLFFFTSKLFSVLIPAFQALFGQPGQSFVRSKGKEIAFGLAFSVIQVSMFLTTVATLLIQSKTVEIFRHGPSFPGSALLHLFPFLDVAFAFVMFTLLYVLLTPLRRTRKKVLVACSVLATIFWSVGKSLFRYYLLYVGRFDLAFGVYGMFVGFLFWVYYSVFILIVCAEIQALLFTGLDGGPETSSH